VNILITDERMLTNLMNIWKENFSWGLY